MSEAAHADLFSLQRGCKMFELIARNAVKPVTISEQLKAATAKVEECNQQLVAADNEIASWARRHDLHFDDAGAVASWPPERIQEFKVLNFNRNELWNEFQAALGAFAQLKEMVTGVGI